MKKVSLFLLMLMTTVLVNAQKIGHTDGQVLLFSMPEITKVNADLEKISGDFTTTANEMQKDYQTKLQEFEANKNTWPEAILQSKYKAIVDLEKNMTDFEQTANQELEKSRNEMLQPLIDKIGIAIEQVAKEEGYSYFYTSSATPVTVGAAGSSSGGGETTSFGTLIEATGGGASTAWQGGGGGTPNGAGGNNGTNYGSPQPSASQNPAYNPCVLS